MRHAPFSCAISPKYAIGQNLLDAVQTAGWTETPRPVDAIENISDNIESLLKPEGLAFGIIQYVFGCLFGRWNVDAFMKTRLEQLPDPYSRLPFCSPGMLQNEKGLPAGNDVINKSYPIKVPWNGFMVDDPGIDDLLEAHEWDVMQGVEAIVQLFWPKENENILSEVCALIGVSSPDTIFL